MSQPRVLILHADGSNRDHEAAQAFEAAGAAAEIVHINQLRAQEKRWDTYQILALPGGFTYADALGSGKLWALDLNTYFSEEVHAFVESGKPVIGICNGFQALVKSGILPSPLSGRGAGGEGRATLTFNAEGHFECRWVVLKPQSQLCLWTRGLSDLIECPVAHGEGRFLLNEPGDLTVLAAHDQIALLYARADGGAANGAYPINPNGSIGDIAGVCNPRGNVLGLMPHPEDHIAAYQHPRWTRVERGRGESGRLGLRLFENGVKYARER
ncbi:MAG TPA: phosphoribosylformylglycinamidine synthase I [Anaerolineae bacterium]|nr:phosphoribosylformylglycinamidine synthase I [Anaerolineae bacterium]